MDALKIEKATIGGFDWGARTADIIAALWPERCKALVSVSGYLIGSQEAGKMPLPPEAELQWWYQYYFATERGRAGYDKYRRDFSKLIWRIASPKWDFDDATFDRTRRIVRQSGSRRHRHPQLSLAARTGRGRAEIRRSGKAACRRSGHRRAHDHPRRRRQRRAASGARRPTPRNSRANIRTGLIKGGVGHNLPQEAPQAFAEAIVDVAERLTAIVPALQSETCRASRFKERRGPSTPSLKSGRFTMHSRLGSEASIRTGVSSWRPPRWASPPRAPPACFRLSRRGGGDRSDPPVPHRCPRGRPR